MDNKHKYINVVYQLYAIDEDGTKHLMEKVEEDRPFFFISGFVLYKAGVEWNIKHIIKFFRKKIPVQLHAACRRGIRKIRRGTRCGYGQRNLYHQQPLRP